MNLVVNRGRVETVVAGTMVYDVAIAEEDLSAIFGIDMGVSDVRKPRLEKP